MAALPFPHPLPEPFPLRCGPSPRPVPAGSRVPPSGRRAGKAGGRLFFAISADYARRTGGWAYAVNLCRSLRQEGWTVQDLILPAGFPNPDPAARESAAAAFAALPDGAVVIADQLCLGVLPTLAAREGRRLRLVMIVHHPLAFELGRPAMERQRLAAMERASLGEVSLVLAASPTVGALLARAYQVPRAKIVTALPGVTRRPLAAGSANGVPQLLSVGALVPRKDPLALVEAMAGLADRPWQLTMVGNRTRHPGYVATIEARLAELGLARRIRLAGEASETLLAAIWHRSDLFLAASTFEGFGIAVAEAISAGLPVVTTAAGGVVDWLDPRAGLIVPVGDAAALQAAIGRVLDEPGLRPALRDGARMTRDCLPTWEACAATVAAAITALPQPWPQP